MVAKWTRNAMCSLLINWSGKDVQLERFLKCIFEHFEPIQN